MVASLHKPGSGSAPPRLRNLNQWVTAIVQIAGHYRLNVSPESLAVDARWSTTSDEMSQVERLARHAALHVQRVSSDIAELSPLSFPLAGRLSDGQVIVLVAKAHDGIQVQLPSDNGLRGVIPLERLREHLDELFALRPATAVPDTRVDTYIAPFRKDWLREILLTDLSPYWNIALASAVANLLALAGIIFSMQVYDRVIPSQSMPTLYVLFGGVVLATIFGFVLRQARTVITDNVGKSADMRISDKVFGHALHIKNSARPRSTGSLVAQLRELEHVRDMMTSSTVSALADIPFFLLFCALFWAIAGSLIWVPLVAAVALILPGIMAQQRLRELAMMNMRESSLRNAMMVEAVQGLEDIKLLQAEPRFLNQWNHFNEVSAGASLKLRQLVSSLTVWSQSIQGFVFAAVVFVGAPMVMNGDMTTGVLVAASILSSRMLAPLASVSQLLNRWQQARIAKQGLDNLLELPVDTPEEGHRIHKPLLHGNFLMKNTVFSHDGSAPALRVKSLHIDAGERIAILGRNGAGKSTLLAGLAGLLEPSEGIVRIDGVTMAHLDPADLRRDVGYLTQNARLFHGTLRENLTLGAPLANDEHIVETLKSVGAWSFVSRNPDGLDYLVQEGGLGLSGGQTQCLLLARTLLREHSVLLLDEPTSSLDSQTEAQVIATLRKFESHRSIIVATHRPALLAIVERVIVVNNGSVVLDGPKDEVLAKLRSGEAGAK